MRLVAQVVREGKVESETVLTYAGEKSTYGGTLRAPAAGEYELRLLAMDPANANFGMHSSKLTVE
jgi:hypothetical protein